MTHLSLTSLKWHTLLTTLGNELNTLDASERVWLVRQVTQIETLQEELDTLFRAARGASACAGCDDTCCGCGRHHVTATNLLAYLLAGETPPEPDFSVTCPFLGNSGCLLPSFRRPYNCITFFCEILEDRLDDVGRERLRDLDRRLRAVYERIAQRYPLASLRGLWIALERAGGGHLLCSPEQDVVE